MRKNAWLIFGILGLLVVAVAAYFWATGSVDSLFSYRSPLKDTPPAAGVNLGNPATQRVVYVLIDGLRYDTSLDVTTMPVLNKLRQQGAYARMTSQAPSFSEPGYSVLFTGAWPYLSDGPALNLDYDEIPTWTQDNVFSSLNRAGLKTGVSAYNWFEKLIPQQDVDVSYYTEGDDRKADEEVMSAALPMLDDTRNQFVFVHLDQVDYAGHHEGGPKDARWNEAAARTDAMLGQILEKLDLSRDTIIVTSDHGHIDAGGHGGQDAVALVEPFVIAGAGIKTGDFGDVNMVDVAPTITTLLGAALPATTQGRALTELLTLPAGTEAMLKDATINQQNQLVKIVAAAIGQSYDVTQISSPTVQGFQALLLQIWDGKITQERIWFFLIAITALAASVFGLSRIRWEKLRWMLIAAVIYVILFNIYYVLILGGTYSFSSVLSVTGMIVNLSLGTAVCLLVSWLLLMGVMRGISKATHETLVVNAQSTLQFIYVVLFLLSIPVWVSVALNGFMVTWRLPDFASHFAALVSLIQILFAALIGLLLTGIGALLSRSSMKAK